MNPDDEDKPDGHATPARPRNETPVAPAGAADEDDEATDPDATDLYEPGPGDE